MDTQLIEQAAFLEKHANSLDQQRSFVAQQTHELEQLYSSLHALITSQESSIFAMLGKGVYIPAVRADRKLFVEVGADVLVQKSPQEVQAVIEQQLKRLKESQQLIENQLTFCMDALQSLMHQLEAPAQKRTTP